MNEVTDMISILSALKRLKKSVTLSLVSQVNFDPKSRAVFFIVVMYCAIICSSVQIRPEAVPYMTS